MPRTFSGLVSDAIHGRGEELVFPDQLWGSIKDSLKLCNENNEVMFRSAVASVEPNAGIMPVTYFRLSSGKQQFCVRFSSGAIQVLATEPD